MNDGGQEKPLLINAEPTVSLAMVGSRKSVQLNEFSKCLAVPLNQIEDPMKPCIPASNCTREQISSDFKPFLSFGVFSFAPRIVASHSFDGRFYYEPS